MKPYERYIKFVNNVTLTFTHEDMTKIKVLHLDELYNFHVHDFSYEFIWCFKMLFEFAFFYIQNLNGSNRVT